MDATRRHWLLGSLGFAAWTEIASAWQEAQSATTYKTLTPADAAEIDALAATILPSDDTPGAREAGVIFFIDRALTTFDSDKRDAYREGMLAVQRTRASIFPDSASIAALTPEQQMELMRAIEKTEFFELLRTHVMLGFLGPPSYGGNRDQVGWKLIGFEHRMAFTPPFGFYDAAAMKEDGK